MLWTLRATRSGHVFNPRLAPTLGPPTATDLLINPLRVDVDVSTFFREAVELENAHSLDELNDIHIMPDCLPLHLLPSAPPPADASKRMHPVEPAADGPGGASSDEGAPVPRCHRKRRKARAQKTAAEGHCPCEHTMRMIRETAEPIHTNLATEALPSAKGIYSALNFREPDAEQEYTVNELLALGFSEVPWEG